MSTLYSVTATLNKDGIVDDSVAVFDNEDAIVLPGTFYFVENVSNVWNTYRSTFEPCQYVSIALYAEDKNDAVEKFYQQAVEEIQAYKVYVKYSDFIHDVDPCEATGLEYGLTLRMDEIYGWIWGTCGYEVDVQLCDFVGDELTNYDAMRQTFTSHTDGLDDQWLQYALGQRSYRYAIETMLEYTGCRADQLKIANNLVTLITRLTSETESGSLKWRNINNDTYRALLPESITVRKINDRRMELAFSCDNDWSYGEDELYFQWDKTVDPSKLARGFAVEITYEFADWDTMPKLFAAVSSKEAQG